MNLLIVCTSTFQLPSGRSTGLWLEDYAVVHDGFARASATLTVASPLGGPLPLDPRCEPDAATRWRWASALKALNTSERLDTLDEHRFDGMLVCGGAGALVDLPRNPPLQRLVGSLIRAGKPVASLGYGAAAFLELGCAKGPAWIRGRQMTSVSKIEDRFAGMSASLPYSIEDALRARGAIFDSRLGRDDYVVCDQNVLLTGQNSAAAPKLAQQILARCRDRLSAFERIDLVEDDDSSPVSMRVAESALAA